MSNITCTKFEAISGTKRCKHYASNGACNRPDEFMCVEWLKLNGPAAASVTAAPLTRLHALNASMAHAQSKARLSVSQVAAAKSLGAISQVLGPDKAPAGPRTRLQPSDEVALLALRQSLPGAFQAQATTAVDIASFKARGIEVCVATDDLGEFWIVPEYSDAERQELTIEHASLIAAACSAFPGSKVTAVRRKK
jgi:hypothetical protein